ncbi:MAG: 5-(carboxyamino)imidazole ribonucleotide mutase, partial [Candidatus Omnitrophota bacterium]
PLDTGVLKGVESLLSIVEVPRGIGLVSTGLGKKGFINAVIFALKILSLKNKKHKKLLEEFEKMFKK